MQKVKYQKISKNEKEIIINDQVSKKIDFVNNEEKVFDFRSINDYSSIFSYNKSNSFLRKNDLRFEHSKFLSIFVLFLNKFIKF